MRSYLRQLFGRRASPPAVTTPELRNALLSSAQAWEALAREDPLWAILYDPSMRGNRWDVDEFFRTGETLIERIAARAGENGALISGNRAIDFGCGVGRLTRALGYRFDSVLGIDVSKTMIDIARALHEDWPNLLFMVNIESSLAALKDDHADFVCSHITLQHLHPALAKRYIREFFRVVRPGGYVYFQIPSYKLPPAAPLPAEHCRARIVVLEAPALMRPRTSGRVVATVRNVSAGRWYCPLLLGNHWRDDRGNLLCNDDGRALLPPLTGDGEARVTLTVSAPARPGRYVLELDIVQEGVRWFGDTGNPTAAHNVAVDSNAPVEENHMPQAVLRHVSPSSIERHQKEMHGVAREDIMDIAKTCGAQAIRIDGLIADWMSYEYIFRKL